MCQLAGCRHHRCRSSLLLLLLLLLLTTCMMIIFVALCFLRIPAHIKLVKLSVILSFSMTITSLVPLLLRVLNPQTTLKLLTRTIQMLPPTPTIFHRGFNFFTTVLLSHVLPYDILYCFKPVFFFFSLLEECSEFCSNMKLTRIKRFSVCVQILSKFN